MNNLRKTIACLLFATFPVITFSQNFTVGKIIDSKGDTIQGLINYKVIDQSITECRFKKSEKSEVRIFQPGDIQSFILEKGKRKFIAATISQHAEFLEVLCEGNVNLYRMISKPNFFIRRKDEKAFHNLPYSSQEVYVDNGYTRQYKTVETTFHIDTLRRAMNDRPELFPEIEKVRYPNKKDLVGVISKYNKLDSKELNATIDSNSDFEVELLKEGKINLYVSKNQTAGNQFYIQKGPGTKLIELPFANQPDTYIQGQLIRSYQHSTTNHIDSLKKYMADALLLHPMIENISIPTKSKLINLIDEYNSYTDESSYIQKHTIKRLPLNVEITPGLYFTFINAGNRIDKYGSYINIGFTNKNKHCFAKTGLFAYNGNTPLTDRYYIENGRYFPPATTYKIPLQFEYRFTNTAVQPCLSFGYNLYFFDEIAPFNISLMPAVAPGLNIRLAGRLSVHFNLELEFTNGSLLAYYPKSLKMGSLFTGLQIKL